MIRHRFGSRLLLVPSVAAVLFAATPASAVERKGFVIGFEVGAGRFTCDGCEGLNGLDAGFHLGWMLSDGLALILDGASVVHPENDSVLASSIGGIGLRFFAGDRVWLQGLVGVGGLDAATAGLTVTSDRATAVAGGLGVELLQGRSFALALAARVGSFKLGDSRVTNVSIHLDFTWH